LLLYFYGQKTRPQFEARPKFLPKAEGALSLTFRFAQGFTQKVHHGLFVARTSMYSPFRFAQGFTQKVHHGLFVEPKPAT
jgi:hypothetical protein